MTWLPVGWAGLGQAVGPKKVTECVTSHVSCVTCYLSTVFIFFFSPTNWWNYLVEGLLSTWPNPSSFFANVP